MHSRRAEGTVPQVLTEQEESETRDAVYIHIHVQNLIRSSEQLDFFLNKIKAKPLQLVLDTHNLKLHYCHDCHSSSIKNRLS